MKIQCACGTKIAFDVTPDMASRPVQFVCPNCGLDSSAMVNELIRQQFGAAPVPVAAPPAAAAPQSPPVPPPMPLPASAPRPAIRVATHKPVAEAAPAAEAPPGKEPCLKHPGHFVAHKCLVCGKPMCPECMALFGYVCSPLCRNKAESRGLDIPVYAQQKSVVEARRWRKINLVAGSIAGVLALLAGLWFWYAWFGSVPKVTYALQFSDRAKSGAVRLVGKDNLVFLHGGELGRIDMTKAGPAWTVQLVQTNKFGPLADQAIAEMVKRRDRLAEEDSELADGMKIPARDELIEDMIEGAMAALDLHVAGENIWVRDGETMTRYDWQTGQAGKAVTLAGSAYGLRREGDELLLSETDYELSSETIQRFNLVTGETRTEKAEKPLPPRLVTLLAAAATNHPAKGTAKGGRTNNVAVKTATAKAVAAAEARRPSAPLDPQQIAAQAEGMSLAGRIALPVLIANARNQQRIAAELAEDSGKPRRPPTELEKAIEEWDSTRIIPAADGPVQFTRLLIERKLVAREAMKAPPKKSALNEGVSAAQSLEIANEMLNEMQRERGSTVTEDLSRYQVTVKRAGPNVPVWSSEVAGPPAFHPLKTVDLITAGTTVIALDHENKKLWQGVLNYPVSGGGEEFEEDVDVAVQTDGLGPCVERGDTIFIFDQGSLAAFDRATGESRWRLPSVGISGLWFDDKGMLYVNTTTASPDSIRYSKQIDLGNQTLTQILKVDPKTGKTLWSREGAKHIAYLWRQYIYTTDSFPGDDPDGEGIQTGLERGPFLRIRRIDAGSGRILWEHVQKRCPLDLHFHENTIQLMFKKEVQQLKFLAL